MIFLKRFKRYAISINYNNLVNQINKQNVGYGSGVAKYDDANFCQMYVEIYERVIHISLCIQFKNKHDRLIFFANVGIGFSKNKNGIFTKSKYYIDDWLQRRRIDPTNISNIYVIKLLNMIEHHGGLLLRYQF